MLLPPGQQPLAQLDGLFDDFGVRSVVPLLGHRTPIAVSLISQASVAAFGSSLTAITLAELGDKTFFMALILAVRHKARWVFVGSFAALAAVTFISLGVGYGLRELVPAQLLPWLAALLFLGFGAKLLLDAQGLSANAAAEEAEEAAEEVEKAEAQSNLDTAWGVIWKAFALVFVAELGDRTQFTTIFLAAAPAFTLAGLVAGTLLGHAVVTALAVGAGKWIGSHLSEKLLYRLSGGLFIAFGLYALQQALS
jgi:Ca2+/H+ antiporter, TMEM165/GDT1 family